MNKEEFLKEALDSGMAGETFKEDYEEFNQYQDLALNALKEFHRVCEKNNVEYFLAFGSLLGVIRDGGQIPWDYDIDVCVKIEEREKLIDALKKDLSGEYYFYCPEVNSSCRHSMIRITPKGYSSEALHVDVFYIVGLPNEKNERVYVQKRLVALARYRFLKKVKIFKEARHKPLKIIKLICGKIVCLIISNSKIDSEYEYITHKYPINSSEMVSTADVFSFITIMPSNIFDSSMIFDTHDGEFRIPVKYIDFLKCRYNNYLEYLPIGERINEVVDSLKYIRNYDVFDKKKGNKFDVFDK